jgi:RNA polymerase sigma-70 factor (ECF subfamily)
MSRTPGSKSDAALLAMDEALKLLEAHDPLKVHLLEMRYFGGMTAEESAVALSVSVHFVRRELRLAQAWLRKDVGQA